MKRGHVPLSLLVQPFEGALASLVGVDQGQAGVVQFTGNQVFVVATAFPLRFHHRLVFMDQPVKCSGFCFPHHGFGPAATVLC